VKDKFSKYIPIADAIALLFQPYAEVVIHDTASDTVAYIANPFSGRKIGDASLLGPLEENPEGFPYGFAIEGPYENAGNKGQRIRSISIALEDDQGGIIGIMCTNADFSVMEASLDVLENFLRPRDLDAPPKVLFQNDWKDNIKLEIRTFLTENKIRFDKINSAHRKSLVERLEGNKRFYARKSIEQLADILGVSRATVYNDLRLIRKDNTKGIQVLG
jgi:predicted transcriptional regulator YheO